MSYNILLLFICRNDIFPFDNYYIYIIVNYVIIFLTVYFLAIFIVFCYFLLEWLLPNFHININFTVHFLFPIIQCRSTSQILVTYTHIVYFCKSLVCLISYLLIYWHAKTFFSVLFLINYSSVLPPL